MNLVAATAQINAIPADKMNAAKDACEHADGVSGTDKLELRFVPFDIAQANLALSTGKPFDQVADELVAKLSAALTIDASGNADPAPEPVDQV